jgi:hypothetical protein
MSPATDKGTAHRKVIRVAVSTAPGHRAAAAVVVEATAAVEEAVMVVAEVTSRG